eukprot:4420525-Pleurochrysis_carterae.AAC.2
MQTLSLTPHEDALAHKLTGALSHRHAQKRSRMRMHPSRTSARTGLHARTLTRARASTARTHSSPRSCPHPTSSSVSALPHKQQHSNKRVHLFYAIGRSFGNVSHPSQPL